jgi:O-acetyl-ADP-ribose deacetylase (regulator of RNase III)
VIQAICSVAAGFFVACVVLFAVHSAASSVTWSAVAGGGAGLATFIASYVALRCFFAPSTNQEEATTTGEAAPLKAGRTTPQSDGRDWSQLIVKDIVPYPGDLEDKSKIEIEAARLRPCIVQIIGATPSIQFLIREQDIIKESGAEVIVNAANTELVGGGGVDHDIHVAGGDSYKNEHQVQLKSQYPQGYVSGHAALIGSGSMKYGIKNVIVVAGPEGKPKSEQEATVQETALYNCFRNSLILAARHNLQSIAFPVISGGIFAFPLDRIAEISLRAISDFSKEYPGSSIKKIAIHYQAPPKANQKTIVDAYHNMIYEERNKADREPRQT